MNNEIEEIMNGNREIKHLRIEGETLGFDTQFNSNWNFMPRDIEGIIYTLQQENQQLKDRINKAIEYIGRKEYQYGDEEQDLYDYDIGFDEVNELLDLLKGDKE